MAANPVAVFDFTQPAADLSADELKPLLKQLFKKWTFQLEQGDSGYLHFQGRGSLYKKRRLPELKPMLTKLGLSAMHLSVTSDNALGDAFYCMKLDTRVEGPWSDNDPEPPYIPRQYRDITLYPWQQALIDKSSVFDPRTVHFIYDPEGCRGKSTVASICCLLHKGLRVPAVNDHEKLLATVCDILMAKEERQPGPIFIDLPRFMEKSKLHGIFTAIEEIKNGHAYDLRYNYKEWWFDSPPVWVFSNVPPPMHALSHDRWRFHQIDCELGLTYLDPQSFEV